MKTADRIRVTVHSLPVQHIPNTLSLYKVGLASGGHAVHFAWLPHETHLGKITTVKSTKGRSYQQRELLPGIWTGHSWEEVTALILAETQPKFHRRIRRALVTLAMLNNP